MLNMKDKVTAVQLITPEIAIRYLEESNYDNRLIRMQHVNNLANSITSGEWKVTHQGIAFSKSGRLIDGQHRLKAIILSGIPVEINVTTGQDDDTYAYSDLGLSKTVSDILLINPRVSKIITEATRRYKRVWLKPTVQDLQLMNLAIGQTCQLLIDCCGKSTKHFSTAPVSLMVVCFAIREKSTDRAFSLYKNLNHHEYAELSPVCLSWMKQVAEGSVGADSTEILTRAYIALSGDGNKEKMMVTQHAKDNAIKFLYETLNMAMIDSK